MNSAEGAVVCNVMVLLERWLFWPSVVMLVTISFSLNHERLDFAAEK
jgi:hypothetical protein